MKKLLLGLGTIATVGGSIAGVVSCAPEVFSGEQPFYAIIKGPSVPDQSIKNKDTITNIKDKVITAGELLPMIISQKKAIIQKAGGPISQTIASPSGSSTNLSIELDKGTIPRVVTEAMDELITNLKTTNKLINITYKYVIKTRTLTITISKTAGGAITHASN